MTEAQLVHTLLDALARRGWMVCHFRPARTAHGWRTAIEGHAGAPDIIAVHPVRGILLIEAKASDGRLRPEQVQWKEAAEAASERYPEAIRYLVARPRDWTTGALDAIIGIEGDRR